MVLQADSVQVEAAEEESLQNPVVHTGELTPRKVLSWLPRNATPAQQDSMIRAHIKPSEIRWSTMSDTLHLPGHPAGKSFRDVSLPQYYRENGAIYILKVDYLLKEKALYKNKCYAYIMEKSHSVDIDEEIDFAIAKAMFKNRG